MPSPPRPGEPSPASNAAPPEANGRDDAMASPVSTAVLIEKLQADRLWLLRQIDAGAWPQWRLDLAALERELGELLERVTPLPDSRD